MSEDGFPTWTSGGPPQRSAVRRLLRVLVLLVLIAAAVVVLFTWVFPWVEELTQNPTLGAQLLRVPR
ncbi:MAG: hypothetical protein ACNA8R_05045 [Nitriliruptoraceae bacterium]